MEKATTRSQLGRLALALSSPSFQSPDALTLQQAGTEIKWFHHELVSRRDWGILWDECERLKAEIVYQHLTHVASWGK